MAMTVENILSFLGKYFLEPCYLMCGPGAYSIGITWELVRNQSGWPSLRPAKSEPVFSQDPQDMSVHFTFSVRWLRV